MLAGYRPMWLIVMFDLPTVTDTEKKKASKFRNTLLDLGFSMSQYSVYFRFLPSKEAGDTYKKKLIPNIPPKGRVQFLLISDKQFENIYTYFGSLKEPPKTSPEQLLLF
jgi:CRISPR-associated protein Cas2